MTMKFKKKDCIAMILAGGQGSRLMVLTESTAKAGCTVRRKIQTDRLRSVQYVKLGHL